MKLIFLILLLFPLISFSQAKATFERDTIFYAGKTFTAGDTIQLAYGSGSNKQFIFVKMGSGVAGWDELSSSYSKAAVVIKKVQQQKGKVFARGKLIHSPGLINNTIEIDIEGAIDNKEIY